MQRENLNTRRSGSVWGLVPRRVPPGDTADYQSALRRYGRMANGGLRWIAWVCIDLANCCRRCAGPMANRRDFLS